MKGIMGSFLIMALCLSLNVYAQNSRETGKKEQVHRETEHNAAYSVNKKKNQRKKKNPGYGYADIYDKKIKEYEDRMDAVAKDKSRKERQMKKPQYSDPGYFGHKRKPKKRPPGKKKYCKECGLYH